MAFKAKYPTCFEITLNLLTKQVSHLNIQDLTSLKKQTMI
jgi:hypothetical protein